MHQEIKGAIVPLFVFAAAVPYGGRPFELRMPQAGGRTGKKFFKKLLTFGCGCGIILIVKER